MPYAPTVNDNSGQILAQGINQGIGSLAEGIQRSIAERKKKEEERNAKEAVNAAGKGVFGEDFDVKDAKPEQYGAIIQMAQAKRDEPMRLAEQKFKQAQIDNFALQAQLQQSEAARRQSDDAAMRAVYGGQSSSGPSVGLTESQTGMTGTPSVQGGPTAADASNVYAIAAQNGASAATMGQIANIERDRAATTLSSAQATKALQPRDTGVSYLNPPDDAKWMVDANGNVHPVNPTKLDPNARIEFEVNGVKFVKQGGTLFNATTSEVVGPAKPLDPNTQSLLASRLSAAQEIADKPQGMIEGKATFEKRVRDAQFKANLAATSLGVRLPYPPAEALPGRVGAPSLAAKRFQIVAEPSK